jgi:LAGLIDADG DNA endonuclease family
MDDGSLIGRKTSSWTYSLNTQSFSYDENNILKQVLEKKYNVMVNLQKDRRHYKLSLSVHSKEDFRTLIKPFVLQSFYYKLFPLSDYHESTLGGDVDLSHPGAAKGPKG